MSTATHDVHDLIIVGAGPAGLALAVEARATACGLARTLVLEKSACHNGTIRQLYPEHKLTTANYKGFEARCEGLLCVGDMTKQNTIAYFDRVITENGVRVQYGAEVYGMHRIDRVTGASFRVESSCGSYETRVLAVAVGIFGRPNKPKEYPLPPGLRERLLFDVSSIPMEGEDVLVVGGGDTAAEYVQHLHDADNRVTLSYRGAEFQRMTGRNRDALLSLAQAGAISILRSSNIDRVEREAGRPRVVFREVPHAATLFDRVVYALGGTTPTNFLRTLGVGFTEKGPIVGYGGETDVPGLFLVGDLVVGRVGGSINTAFNSAVHAMRCIAAKYLSDEPQVAQPTGRRSTAIEARPSPLHGGVGHPR